MSLLLGSRSSSSDKFTAKMLSVVLVLPHSTYYNDFMHKMTSLDRDHLAILTSLPQVVQGDAQAEPGTQGAIVSLCAVLLNTKHILQDRFLFVS